MLVTSFANVFSQPIGCLLVLFIVSFAIPNLISLIRFHLFLFAFISIALWDWPKKILVWFMSENILPMFSSRSLMGSVQFSRSVVFNSLRPHEWDQVLYLNLKVVLNLFLCMVWGCVATLLIYMWLSSFSNTTCLRDCLFSIFSFLPSLSKINWP